MLCENAEYCYHGRMKKRYSLLVAVFALLAGCTTMPQAVIPSPEPFATFATSTVPVVEPAKPNPPVPPPSAKNSQATVTPEQKPPVEKPAPNAINLAVPFRAQAPFGDWSEPYENACEEASIIMVDYYLRGATLSAQQMKDAIDAQVAWQIKNWGGHNDLPIAKVKDLAAAQYPYRVQIIDPLTIDAIKQELRKGLPVIVPTAGRALGNPYFTAPGPIYHMLVIKGYRADGTFITNDPGTKHGADYVYSSATLMSAIHDWTGSAADGGAVGLVMYK